MKRQSFSGTKSGSIALQSKLSTYRQKFNKSQQKFHMRLSWINDSMKGDNKMKDKNNKNYRSVSAIAKRSGKQRIDFDNNNKKILENNQQSQSITLNPQKALDLTDNKNMKYTQTKLISTLKAQTFQITQYAQRNRQLLSNKNQLQQHIQYLKQQMGRQKKLLNNSKVECGKLNNEIEKCTKRLNQMHQRNQIIQQKITTKYQQINIANKINSQKNKQSQDNKQYIKNLQHYNFSLSDIKILNLKSAVYKQQIQRQLFKNKLIQQLKVMDNNAVLYQQTIAQRENLRINIQNYVNQNKIAENNSELLKKSRKSNY